MDHKLDTIASLPECAEKPFKVYICPTFFVRHNIRVDFEVVKRYSREKEVQMHNWRETELSCE